MEITSDIILSSAGGFGGGFFAGLILKKTVKILFKILMTVVVIFITALVYLQSIKVITINEQALNNLVNEGYNQLNQTIGQDAIVNPMSYIITNLGLPMSSSLAIGLIAGWSRG